MASSKDIGGLHATLTANANQYVAEFNRADQATQMHARGMATATETLVKDVERSFTGAKFAKGLLEGLGIGTGITAITRVAGLFVGMWEEGDKYAKDVDERATSIGTKLKELAKIKFDWGIELAKTDIDKLKLITADIARIKAQMAQQEALRESATEGMGFVGRLERGQGLTGVFAGTDYSARDTHGRIIGGTPAKEAGDSLSAAADAAQARFFDLNKELIARQKEENALKKAQQRDKDAQDLLTTSPRRDMGAIKDITPEQEAFASGIERTLKDEARLGESKTQLELARRQTTAVEGILTHLQRSGDGAHNFQIHH